MRAETGCRILRGGLVALRPHARDAGIGMLKEKAYIFGRINVLLDLALGAAAFFLAYSLRAHVLAPYFFPNLFRPTTLSDQLWLLVLMPPLAVLALAYNGYYSSQRIRNDWEIFRTIAISVGEAAVASLAIIYFYKSNPVSRAQLLVMPVVQLTLIWLKTVVARRVLIGLRRRGYNFRRVLLVGSGEPVREFIRMLRANTFWGFHIEGIISDDATEKPGDSSAYEGCRVVGRLKDTLNFLWDHAVDEVIFLPHRASQAELAPVLEGCEEMGVRTHLALNAFRHQIARPELDRFEDVPVVTYSPVRSINTALVIKYAFDRVAAAILLLVLSPLFAAVALAIWLTSSKGEPIFYGQKRCGLNGKLFTCWKFRTMRVGADREVESLRDKNEMEGPVFKIRDDPRVTRVGRFLRRTSLDEMPQFYNVLRGEMSLVGPRPPLPEEIRHYDRWQRRRLSMKPGITCLWQVGGRNEIPFEKWMRLDLEYIDNWSLLLDFWILVKTLFVVLTRRGAM